MLKPAAVCADSFFRKLCGESNPSVVEYKMKRPVLKKEALSDAITAHACWKVRLRNIVSSGVSDTPIAVVHSDNKCEFGRWLYGPEISGTDKQSDTYLKVKELHAAFHKEAAKVVELATSNQKHQAAQAIGMGGSYAKASTALTEAMILWRNKTK